MSPVLYQLSYRGTGIVYDTKGEGPSICILEDALCKHSAVN
ncbi:MAG: hypothetical protein G01um101425_640 [Candidatus Peregrinibacteria bacterium Gr01-1014_25]|nr:MAG: hypothetical protein G01um101425_640 [Candidatus Peregrinibacteria bacterium Gr01-1014_25]